MLRERAPGSPSMPENSGPFFASLGCNTRHVVSQQSSTAVQIGSGHDKPDQKLAFFVPATHRTRTHRFSVGFSSLHKVFLSPTGCRCKQISFERLSNEPGARALLGLAERAELREQPILDVDRVDVVRRGVVARFYDLRAANLWKTFVSTF